SDLLLRPGMTATATITVARQPQVLLVPMAALRYAPPVTESADRSGSGLIGLIMPRRGGETRARVDGSSVWVVRAGQPGKAGGAWGGRRGAGCARARAGGRGRGAARASAGWRRARRSTALGWVRRASSAASTVVRLRRTHARAAGGSSTVAPCHLTTPQSMF